jgi:hypothetical protein
MPRSRLLLCPCRCASVASLTALPPALPNFETLLINTSTDVLASSHPRIPRLASPPHSASSRLLVFAPPHTRSRPGPLTLLCRLGLLSRTRAGRPSALDPSPVVMRTHDPVDLPLVAEWAPLTRMTRIPTCAAGGGGPPARGRGKRRSCRTPADRHLALLLPYIDVADATDDAFTAVSPASQSSSCYGAGL